MGLSEGGHGTDGHGYGQRSRSSRALPPRSSVMDVFSTDSSNNSSTSNLALGATDEDMVLLRKPVGAHKVVPEPTLLPPSRSLEPSPVAGEHNVVDLGSTDDFGPRVTTHRHALPTPPQPRDAHDAATSNINTGTAESRGSRSGLVGVSQSGMPPPRHADAPQAITGAAPPAPSAPAPSAPSQPPSLRGRMGPRPLPKRMPSNLAPASNPSQPSLSRSSTIETRTADTRDTQSQASRRTDIPAQTIRDLEATLKDIADLDGQPESEPQQRPSEPQPQPPSLPIPLFDPLYSVSSTGSPLLKPTEPSTSPTAEVDRAPSISGQSIASRHSGTRRSPSRQSSGSIPPIPSAASTMSRKPKGPRLSVTTAVASAPNLGDTLRQPDTDRQPVSPGMKHWQQVRQHVLAPTPPEERAATGHLHPHARPPQQTQHAGHKGLKYVTKAVERFGFRNAVENVMGHDRRGSAFGGYSFGGNLTQEEREEASRHRRRFARDIKICLDNCGMEESNRRLNRMAPVKNNHLPNDMHPKHPHPSKTGNKGWTFNTHHQHGNGHGTHPETNDSATSTYAPLLTQLHRYLPDARAKRVWSRTCPHHATILAELGVTFIQDGVSTDAERIQALEVFGTVVRNWSTDSADEELDRWLWLCRAMLVDDKPLRMRGLTLLSQMLRSDPALPEPLVRPVTAADFEAVAIALIRLLYALESSPQRSLPQRDIVSNILADLSNGEIIKVDTTTLAEISDDIDKNIQLDTLERELLWMAAGRALAVDQSIATWLLAEDSAVLKRYSPPPILRATAPVILRLRVLSATQFFASLSSVVRRTSNLDLVASIADAADLVHADAHLLCAAEDSLAVDYVTVLLDIELKRTEGQLGQDPFADARSASTATRSHLLQLLKESTKSVVNKVAEQLVTSYPMAQRLTAIRYFLESDLADLGAACVPYFLQRLTPASGENKQVRPFLKWLSRSHPRLFYKPLFACAAATQMSTLRPHLRTVTTMSKLIGSDTFWTQAEPEMVVIVLMGGSGNGSRTLQYRNEIAVKPGRYAAMLELVLALQTLKTGSSPKASLKTFLTTLETRLAAMLEIEERKAPLPVSYRSLTCQLFVALRNASWWTKRNAAIRLAVSWFAKGESEFPRSADLPPSPSEDDQVTALRDLVSVDDRDNDGYVYQPRLEILDQPLIVALTTLLVTVQASTTEADWATVLPALWDRYSLPREPNLPMAFLLTKCAEVVPNKLFELVMNELVRSTDSTSPYRTLLKLAMLYGYRFQLLKLDTIADDRGVFKFPGKVFEFVATEMGSDQWVVPRDAQDEALQKYGQSLPLELRQRLMELGWSEEKDMSVADYERIPVTLLPLSELSDTMSEGDVPPPTAPAPKTAPLQRTVSNSSAVAGVKTRRPILPPILLRLINQQARVLYASEDVNVATVSFELVRMVEREDASALIRPINDNLPVDLENIIRRVNLDAAVTTPSFAHAVINSLVGFLKVSVRDNGEFPHWARILNTVSRVVPHVSEMSLRDIRKSKAEPVLLPGSIYEDGAGFKLHQPWRAADLPIQTAQLVLLTELLRANGRDVYLIKKLLFNLQVQASFAYLPFARAWLELVVQLFTGLNSNYNDRAEFRHFLNNITYVIGLHGRSDIIVAAQAMRALSVCAVRFRRVFASIGFVGCMRVVYETYVFGHATIKDCIEYALRSIYRIHRDVFVYQLCLALAEDPFDSKAAYDLVASLSVPNDASSGVASGIRGLNDRQEKDALLQMLRSGAELTLAEIGSSAEERTAHKAANLNLDPVLFPRDNIIRLLVTVIAANAASPRARRLMRLFAVLIPYMSDPASKELLPEGIDAIGRFIHKEKLGDDQEMLRFLPGEESAQPNWEDANREYVLLVDVAVKHGCALSIHATRRLLDIVLILLQTQAGQISPVASSVLGSLMRIHLAGRQPNEFLRDIAPTFRQSLASVDFSGVLDSITDLIRRSSYDVPPQTAALITHEYVAPVIRMLAFASEENMAFIVPVRNSAVELLAASVFLPGSETLDVLESVSSSPGLLASVILPLVLLLDKPREIDREEVHSNFWIRILRAVLHPMTRASRVAKSGDSPLTLASMAFLSLQIVKVVILRAPECISAIPGLWSYIAAEVLKTIADGDGRFFYTPLGAPRVVDWMMWSLFELLVLHRTPLHIDCRLKIQTVLAKMENNDDDTRSKRSSIVSDSTRGFAHTPGRSLSGLVRRPSARIPVSPTTSNVSSELTTPRRVHQRTASNGSQHLTPRTPGGIQPLRSASGASPGGLSSATSPIRPSFAALSARRASRPVLDVFPESRDRANRFPSSAPVRALQVNGQGEKSAIVHLLGPATHVASTASTGVGVIGLLDPRRSALRDVRLRHPDIVAEARKAVATTMAVYGYDTGNEEPMLQVWSVADALHAVTQQTKMVVEEDFREVFNPPRDGKKEALSQWTSLNLARENEKDGSFYIAESKGGEGDDRDGDNDYLGPNFSFTVDKTYDEPNFQTFTFQKEGDEQIAVPTLSISQFS